MNARSLTVKSMLCLIAVCVTSCGHNSLDLNVNFKGLDKADTKIACAVFDFIEMDEQDIDQVSEKLAKALAKHNEAYLQVCSKEKS